MASYKIYFLDFCYKNYPLTSTKRLAELQNASSKPRIIKKVISVDKVLSMSPHLVVEHLKTNRLLDYKEYHWNAMRAVHQ